MSNQLTADAALAHVEELEYLKARAKAAALAAVSTFAPSADSFLRDDQVDEQLRDAILAAVLPWSRRAADEGARYAALLGYGEAPDASAVDGVVQETLSTLGADARSDIQDAVDRIHFHAGTALNQGVAPAVVLASLRGPAASAAWYAPVNSVASSLASSAVQGTEREVLRSVLLRPASRQPGAAPKRFDWLTVGDGNECDGEEAEACLPRAGKVRTLAEWLKVGLPGAPILRCSVWSKTGVSMCRCALRAATGTPPDFSKLDATEAVANGKKRAEAA